MNELKKNAVISVNDKTNAPELIDGLLALNWQPFVTEGTAKKYFAVTGIQLPSLAELVTEVFGGEQQLEREGVAQAVASILLQQEVGLVCVNLRPSGLLYDMSTLKRDIGGVAMLTAALESGAIPLTHPDQYESVIQQLRSGGLTASVSSRLYQKAEDYLDYYTVQADARVA